MKNRIFAALIMSFMANTYANAGDALTGVDLGSIHISGKVEVGKVEASGRNSGVTLSGVFLGEGTSIDFADINRQIEVEKATASNGGTIEIGSISAGDGTNIDRLLVDSTINVGKAKADGGYISVGSLELQGIRADSINYEEAIEAGSLSATGNGSGIIIGGIHR